MAAYIEEGDQILIGDEQVEVRQLLDSDDISTVRLMVWSWVEGDIRPVDLPATDYYDLWSI